MDISPRPFPVVVIGGSAGALEPLQTVAAGLPSDLDAAVFVVFHVPPDSVSALPHILSRSGPLFATHGIDGAPIAPNRIIIAPPNHHLIISGLTMRVLQGPRENHQRPAIDVLFRSAAEWYGPATCGVLLSGTLDDGIAGLSAIREAGGRCYVQDPQEAQFPDMPRHAIEAGVVDGIFPSQDLSTTIVNFTVENPSVRRAAEVVRDEREVGEPSVFTCPDCGGTLWEYHDRFGYRYRCRTGHAFSEVTMLAQQERTIEYSLWAAMRALEERRDMLDKIENRARSRGDNRTADRMKAQVQEVQNDIAAIAETISEVMSRQGIASQAR